METIRITILNEPMNLINRIPRKEGFKVKNSKKRLLISILKSFISCLEN